MFGALLQQLLRLLLMAGMLRQRVFRIRLIVVDIRYPTQLLLGGASAVVSAIVAPIMAL